ncbi:MAG TPA: hypothetical protein VNO43_06820 [Candidatus Eisenbacteria bacterium]|nr:hypothetical protein [Candidatus Eisenbacteria bacterium]
MTDPLWPLDQLFVTQEKLSEFRARCATGFEALRRQMAIEEDLSSLLEAVYLPLAAWLDRRRTQQADTLVVGVSGPQGSGKSTLAALLKLVLQTGFDRRIVAFSLDDLYKTRSEREAMAKAVHSLFATRGVPGTHDVELGIETIKRLKRQKAGQSTTIPAFDKAIDDRLPKRAWPRVKGELDLILFEGWCVGALPQPRDALDVPVNALERSEDPDGAWRRSVNDALAGDYQRLFALVDVLVYLRPESFARVFEWRRLQEHKLACSLEQRGAAGAGRVMSDVALKRFIMHYERLSRHMLDTMPQRADIVLSLNARQRPYAVRINKPLAPGQAPERRSP